METKEILFCIDSLQEGGAESIMRNTVNELSKDNNLHITIQLLKGKSADGLNKNITLHTFMNESIIYRKLIKYMPARLLHRIIIKGKYNIEIAYMEGAATKVVSGCKNKNTKKIAWVHTDMEKYPWSQRSYRNSDEEKDAYGKFDQIVCVSSDVKKIFEKKYNIQAIYTQNIIDNQQIIELSNIDEKLYSNGSYNIISVGALKPVKGYERLINLHKTLCENGIKCDHYIVGDGPEKHTLLNKISEAHLTDRIHLVGYKKNPYPWIKQADLFVCSSYAEGYSSVVSESIILGTPVVTTDCCGMRDILGDSEYGLIVENSEDGLYQGIDKMIKNKEFYLHYKRMAQVRSIHFDKKSMIKRLRDNLAI